MITVHKTVIARQNNSQYFLRPPPKKNTFHKSRFQGSPCIIKGSPKLPRSSHPAHQDGHFNIILCVILPLKSKKLHF